MLKMLTANTMEIDDIELAVEEILEQLDIDANLLQHSVGLCSCYSEYIESGVLKGIADALPFDIVGTTTLGNCDRAEISQLMFSIAVLTSDDIEFCCELSESMAGDQMEPLKKMYESAKNKMGAEPTMMFSYVPLLFHVGGDQTIAMLDEISGGVPNFGTVTVDNTNDYHLANVFMNDDYATDKMAIVLARGPIDPIFVIAQVSEEKIIKQKAIITKSVNNVLMEVNGITIVEYMESLGLAKNGHVEGQNSFPFMVDARDGTKPLARAIYAITPEGHAVCGGQMFEGSSLSVATIDYEDVIHTTKQMIQEALDTGKRAGMLMFSCISRNLALEMDTLAEMEAAQQVIGDQIPYQFSYSGGEVCPVYNEDGKAVSRFHNDTLVICIL